MHHFILYAESFGAGRVYIDTLTRDSARQIDRKKAFHKLKDLIKILFPSVPVSRILALSSGCTSNGSQVLVVTLQEAPQAQEFSNVD